MLRLGIVGANGQVGAELCVLLAARKDLELIPICRNRSGSAFLRWQGIACRHGRIADEADAHRLLSDCDVVINSSLASGTPSQIRRVEARIIANIFGCSKDSATIVHFSTQSVYGDPSPGRWIRWRSPYGRAKLATERRVRALSRETRKRCYVLRLGHVCGAMQEISNTIRADIRAGSVVLPAVDRSSNTVFTAAIVGAIDQIIAGTVCPDTYDLMNFPRWTWSEVYDFEAAACRSPLTPKIVSAAPGEGSAMRRWLARAAGEAAASEGARNLAAKLFAYAPESLNARATAWWFARRARTEIAQLSRPQIHAEHLSWVENGTKFFPADRPTIDLLRSQTLSQEPHEGFGSWAADAPDAQRGMPAGLVATSESGQEAGS